MTEDAGARLARLAEERWRLEEQVEHERQQAEALAEAQAEANLYFFRGLLERMVSSFNRSAGAGLAVALTVEANKLQLMQSYSLLAALVVEPAAVAIESPPRSGRVLSRRYGLEVTETGRMQILDPERPGTEPGEAEKFLEGVFMLGLGLYPAS